MNLVFLTVCCVVWPRFTGPPSQAHNVRGGVPWQEGSGTARQALKRADEPGLRMH
ncbi:MAG: hypothetical protein KJO91_08840 [Gammaproteobacteria bacterium]|nr:hypothetical protein [Gammaproteobacteria bacterium]